MSSKKVTDETKKVKSTSRKKTETKKKTNKKSSSNNTTVKKKTSTKKKENAPKKTTAKTIEKAKKSNSVLDEIKNTNTLESTDENIEINNKTEIPKEEIKTTTKTPKFANNVELIAVIVFSLIIVGIIGGMIFFRLHKTSNNVNIDDYVTKNPKSVDDLTDIEKEIIDSSNSDNNVDKKTEDELAKRLENNISDEYREYEKLSDEEKKNLDVIPRKEEIPIDKIDDIKEDIDYNETEVIIPESYNLNDHINITVENQSIYGLCWDFASMKSLETNVALHEGINFDFSELHVDYYTSDLMFGGRPVHTGGNFSDFEYYSILTGPVLEETVPFFDRVTGVIDGEEYNYDNVRDLGEEEYSKFTSLEPMLRVTKTVNFPSVRKVDGLPIDKSIDEEKLNEYRKVIKTHIMKNGSIYAVTEGTTNPDYYCNKGCHVNHAVSIVGWDDNYSKDNFISPDGSKPIHDGAYIVLNSWGKLNSYYYVSYDDHFIETQLSGVISTYIDDAIKISDIKSQVVKDIINDQLKYYTFEFNNEEYITEIALKKVYNIQLNNKNLDNSILEELLLFPNLSEIDLSNNNITDVSILSKLEKLNILDISGNKNVTGYEKLNNLYTLKLNNTNLISLNDISNINLFSLDLSNNPYLDYNSLKLPSKLHRLLLDNTNFNGMDLSNYTDLYELSIRNNNLQNLDLLKGNKTIYVYDISNNDIKDYSALKDIIAGLESTNSYTSAQITARSNNISDITIFNNLNISVLDISNNNITDLSNFKNDNIRQIDLSNNKITKGIKSLANVNVIYLDNCGISSLKDFSKLSNVTTLKLSNNNITDITGLENLEKLYSLNLDNNNITDITPFSNFKNLSSLSLVGNKNLHGKLESNIYGLNLSDCDINNDLDLSGCGQLSLLYLNNNTSLDAIEFIKSLTSKYISVEMNNIEISKEQYFNSSSYFDNKTVYFRGVNISAPLNLDENGNIDLNSDYQLRNLLMQNLEHLKIENGYMNNKVDYIHTNNLNGELIITFRDNNITNLKGIRITY